MQATLALAVPVLLAWVATGCGDENDGGGDRRPFAVTGVRYDPEDDRHLFVDVEMCSEGAVVTATEAPDEVTLDARARPKEIPCTGEQVEVRLDEPLAGRTLVDASTGQPVEAQAADWLLPPDTSTWLPATCEDDSVAEAVRRGIDGGLQDRTLDCDGTWLVVATSTDACPATGEAPEPGCVGNEHVNYFHNDGGFWQIVSVDDCEAARSYDDSFPTAFCPD